MNEAYAILIFKMDRIEFWIISKSGNRSRGSQPYLSNPKTAIGVVFDLIESYEVEPKNIEVL